MRGKIKAAKESRKETVTPPTRAGLVGRRVASSYRRLTVTDFRTSEHTSHEDTISRRQQQVQTERQLSV
jgi:hypothetical protein